MRTAESLLRLSADFRERLRLIRARGSVVDAAEGLIANPFVTAPSLAADLKITRQGALYVHPTLAKAGIVSEDSRAHAVLYVAAEVLEVLQADDAVVG